MTLLKILCSMGIVSKAFDLTASIIGPVNYQRCLQIAWGRWAGNTWVAAMLTGWGVKIQSCPSGEPESLSNGWNSPDDAGCLERDAKIRVWSLVGDLRLLWATVFSAVQRWARHDCRIRSADYPRPHGGVEGGKNPTNPSVVHPIRMADQGHISQKTSPSEKCLKRCFLQT